MQDVLTIPDHEETCEDLFMEEYIRCWYKNKRTARNKNIKAEIDRNGSTLLHRWKENNLEPEKRFADLSYLMQSNILNDMEIKFHRSLMKQNTLRNMASWANRRIRTLEETCLEWKSRKIPDEEFIFKVLETPKIFLAWLTRCIQLNESFKIAQQLRASKMFQYIFAIFKYIQSNNLEESILREIDDFMEKEILKKPHKFKPDPVVNFEEGSGKLRKRKKRFRKSSDKLVEKKCFNENPYYVSIKGKSYDNLIQSLFSKKKRALPSEALIRLQDKLDNSSEREASPKIKPEKRFADLSYLMQSNILNDMEIKFHRSLMKQNTLRNMASWANRRIRTLEETCLEWKSRKIPDEEFIFKVLETPKIFLAWLTRCIQLNESFKIAQQLRASKMFQYIFVIFKYIQSNNLEESILREIDDFMEKEILKKPHKFKPDPVVNFEEGSGKLRKRKKRFRKSSDKLVEKKCFNENPYYVSIKGKSYDNLIQSLFSKKKRALPSEALIRLQDKLDNSSEREASPKIKPEKRFADLSYLMQSNILNDMEIKFHRSLMKQNTLRNMASWANRRIRTLEETCLEWKSRKIPDEEFIFKVLETPKIFLAWLTRCIQLNESFKIAQELRASKMFQYIFAIFKYIQSNNLEESILREIDDFMEKEILKKPHKFKPDPVVNFEEGSGKLRKRKKRFRKSSDKLVEKKCFNENPYYVSIKGKSYDNLIQSLFSKKKRALPSEALIRLQDKLDNSSEREASPKIKPEKRFADLSYLMQSNILNDMEIKFHRSLMKQNTLRNMASWANRRIRTLEETCLEWKSRKIPDEEFIFKVLETPKIFLAWLTRCIQLNESFKIAQQLRASKMFQYIFAIFKYIQSNNLEESILREIDDFMEKEILKKPHKFKPDPVVNFEEGSGKLRKRKKRFRKSSDKLVEKKCFNENPYYVSIKGKSYDNLIQSLFSKKKRALPSEALIRLQDKLDNSSEREASPKIKPEKRFADLSYLMQSNILNDMEIKFHRSLMKQNTLRNMASWANRRIRTLEETCLEWKSRKIPDEEFIFKVLETPKIFLAWLTRCIQLNESFKIAQQLRASKMFQYIFAIFKYIQSNNLEESILREIDDFMEKEILKKPHKFKPDPVVNFEEGSGKLRKRKKRFRKSSDKLVEKKCFNENPYYVSIKGKSYDNLIQSLFSKKKRALPSEALIRLQDKLDNSSEREASPKIKPEKRFADLSYLMQSNILNDMEIKFHRSLMKQNTLRNMASWANRRIRTLEETCLEWKSRKIPDEEFIFKVLETPKIFLAWLTRCIQLNESFKIAQQLRASKMFQYIFAIFKYIQSNNLEESILREIDDFMEKEILKKPHKFKPDPVVNFKEGSGKLRKRKKRFRKSSDKLVEKKCFNENPYYVSIKGKPYDNLIQSLFSKKKRALPSEALIRLQDKLDNSSEREASPKIRKSYDNLIQSLFSKKKRALPSEALIRLQDKLDNSSEREASPKIKPEKRFADLSYLMQSNILNDMEIKFHRSLMKQNTLRNMASWANRRIRTLEETCLEWKSRKIPDEEFIFKVLETPKIFLAWLTRCIQLNESFKIAQQLRASKMFQYIFAIFKYIQSNNLEESILREIDDFMEKEILKKPHKFKPDPVVNFEEGSGKLRKRKKRFRKSSDKLVEKKCFNENPYYVSIKGKSYDNLIQSLFSKKKRALPSEALIRLQDKLDNSSEREASPKIKPEKRFADLSYLMQSNILNDMEIKFHRSLMKQNTLRNMASWANRRIRTLEETCLEWKSRKIPDEEFIFKVLETPKIFLAWLTRCIQLNESFKIAQQLRASKMFQYIFAIFKYIQSNNLEESILREIDDFMEKEILKKPHKFKPDPVVNFEEGSGKLRKRKKRFRKSSDKLVEKKCFNENPYYVSIKGKSYDNLIQSLFSKKKRALPSEALIRLQDKLDNSSEREASPKIKPEKRFADLSYLMQSNILNDMEIKFHRSLMKQNTLRNMASWANRRIRTLEETCLEWKSRKIPDEEFIFKVLETPKIFLAWLTRCIQLNESFKIAQQLRASKMFQYIFAIFKYIQSNNLEESILREIDDFMEKEILKKPHKFKPDPVVNFEEGSGKLRKRKKRFRKSSDKLVEKKCFNENPYYVSIKGKSYDNLIQSLFSKKKRALPSEALIRLQDKLDNSSEREASPKIKPEKRFADLSYLMQSNILNDMEIKFHRSLMKQNTLRNMASWANRRIRTLEETCLEWKSRKIPDEEFIFKVLETPKIFLAWLTRCIQLNESFKIAQQLRASKMFQYIFAIFKYIQSNNLEESILREIDDFMEKEILKKPHKFKPDPVVNFEEGSGKLRKRKKRFRKSSDKLVEKKCFNENPYYVSIKGKSYDNLIQSLFSKKKRALPSEALIRLQDKLDNSSEREASPKIKPEKRFADLSYLMQSNILNDMEIKFYRSLMKQNTLRNMASWANRRIRTLEETCLEWKSRKIPDEEFIFKVLETPKIFLAWLTRCIQLNESFKIAQQLLASKMFQYIFAIFKYIQSNNLEESILREIDDFMEKEILKKPHKFKPDPVVNFEEGSGKLRKRKKRFRKSSDKLVEKKCFNENPYYVSIKGKSYDNLIQSLFSKKKRALPSEALIRLQDKLDNSSEREASPKIKPEKRFADLSYLMQSNILNDMEIKFHRSLMKQNTLRNMASWANRRIRTLEETCLEWKSRKIPDEEFIFKVLETPKIFLAWLTRCIQLNESFKIAQQLRASKMFQYIFAIFKYIQSNNLEESILREIDDFMEKEILKKPHKFKPDPVVNFEEGSGKLRKRKKRFRKSSDKLVEKKCFNENPYYVSIKGKSYDNLIQSLFSKKKRALPSEALIRLQDKLDNSSEREASPKIKPEKRFADLSYLMQSNILNDMEIKFHRSLMKQNTLRNMASWANRRIRTLEETCLEWKSRKIPDEEFIFKVLETPKIFLAWLTRCIQLNESFKIAQQLRASKMFQYIFAIFKYIQSNNLEESILREIDDFMEKEILKKPHKFKPDPVVNFEEGSGKLRKRKKRFRKSSDKLVEKKCFNENPYYVSIKGKSYDNLIQSLFSKKKRALPSEALIRLQDKLHNSSEREASPKIKPEKRFADLSYLMQSNILNDMEIKFHRSLMKQNTLRNMASWANRRIRTLEETCLEWKSRKIPDEEFIFKVLETPKIFLAWLTRCIQLNESFKIAQQLRASKMFQYIFAIFKYIQSNNLEESILREIDDFMEKEILKKPHKFKPDPVVNFEEGSGKLRKRKKRFRKSSDKLVEKKCFNENPYYVSIKGKPYDNLIQSLFSKKKRALPSEALIRLQDKLDNSSEREASPKIRKSYDNLIQSLFSKKKRALPSEALIRLQDKLDNSSEREASPKIKPEKRFADLSYLMQSNILNDMEIKFHRSLMKQNTLRNMASWANRRIRTLEETCLEWKSRKIPDEEFIFKVLETPKIFLAWLTRCIQLNESFKIAQQLRASKMFQYIFAIFKYIQSNNLEESILREIDDFMEKEILKKPHKFKPDPVVNFEEGSGKLRKRKKRFRKSSDKLVEKKCFNENPYYVSIKGKSYDNLIQSLFSKKKRALPSEALIRLQDKLDNSSEREASPKIKPEKRFADLSYLMQSNILNDMEIKFHRSLMKQNTLRNMASWANRRIRTLEETCLEWKSRKIPDEEFIFKVLETPKIFLAWLTRCIQLNESFKIAQQLRASKMFQYIFAIFKYIQSNNLEESILREIDDFMEKEILKKPHKFKPDPVVNFEEGSGKLRKRKKRFRKSSDKLVEKKCFNENPYYVSIKGKSYDNLIQSLFSKKKRALPSEALIRLQDKLHNSSEREASPKIKPEKRFADLSYLMQSNILNDMEIKFHRSLMKQNTLRNMASWANRRIRTLEETCLEWKSRKIPDEEFIFKVLETPKIFLAWLTRCIQLNESFKIAQQLRASKMFQYIFAIFKYIQSNNLEESILREIDDFMEKEILKKPHKFKPDPVVNFEEGSGKLRKRKKRFRKSSDKLVEKKCFNENPYYVSIKGKPYDNLIQSLFSKKKRALPSEALIRLQDKLDNSSEREASPKIRKSYDNLIQSLFSKKKRALPSEALIRLQDKLDNSSEREASPKIKPEKRFADLSYLMQSNILNDMEIKFHRSLMKQNTLRNMASWANRRIRTLEETCLEWKSRKIPDEEFIFKVLETPKIFLAWLTRCIQLNESFKIAQQLRASKMFQYIFAIFKYIQSNNLEESILREIDDFMEKEILKKPHKFKPDPVVNFEEGSGKLRKRKKRFRKSSDKLVEKKCFNENPYYVSIKGKSYDNLIQSLFSKKKRALPSEALIRLQDKLDNSSEREASPKIKPEKRFADLSYLMQSNILNDMEIKFHRSLMKQNTLRNMASWANRRIRTLEETCLEWKSRKIPDEEFIFKVLETPKIFLAWLTRCIQLNESFKIAQQLRASKMFQYIFAIFKYIQSNNLEESILREIDDFMEKEILKKPHKFKPDPVVNFEEGSGKLRKRKKRFRKSSDKLVEKKCFNENPYYVSIKGKSYDNLIQSLFSKKKRALPSEALIRLQDKLDNSSEREASPKIKPEKRFADLSYLMQSNILNDMEIKFHRSLMKQNTLRNMASWANRRIRTLEETCLEWKSRKIPDEEFIFKVLETPKIFLAWLTRCIQLNESFKIAQQLRASKMFQYIFAIFKYIQSNNLEESILREIDDFMEKEILKKPHKFKPDPVVNFEEGSGKLRKRKKRFRKSSDKLVEKKCFNENPYYVSIKGKSYDNLIQSLFSKKKRALPSEALIRLQDKLDNSSEREASPKIKPEKRFADLSYLMQSNILNDMEIKFHRSLMKQNTLRNMASWANRRIRTLEETCLEWKSRKIPDEEFIFKVLETPKIFLAWLTRCIQLNESFKIAQQLRASKMFQYIFAIFKYIQSNNLEESILREIDDFMEKEILKKPHKFKPDPVVNFEEGSGKLRKRKKRFRKSSDKLVEKKCFNENPYYVSIKGKSYDNLIQSLFSKKKRALPSEALIRLQDKLDNSSEREASPKIKPEKRFADLSYLMQSNILNDMEIKFHRSLMKQNTLRNMASWANRRIRTLEETCLEWKSRKIPDEEFIFKVLETPKIFLAWLTRCIQLNESFKIAQLLRASKMFQYIFAIFKYIQSNNLEESILREIDDFMEKEILKKPHKFKPDPVVNFEEGSGKLRKRKKRFRKSSDKLVEKKCFNENPYYVSIKGKSYDNLIQSLFSKKKRALPSEALIRLQDKLDNSSEREASPKIKPEKRFADLSYLMQSNILNDMEIKFHRSLMKQNTLRNMASWANRRIRTLEETCLEWKSRKIPDEEFIFKVLETPKIFLAWLTRCIQLNESFKIAQQLRASKMFQYIFAIFKYIQSNNLEESILREIDDFMEKEILKKPHKFKPDPVVNFEEGSGKLRKRKKRFRKSSDKLVEKKCFNENPYYVSIKGKSYDNLIQSLFSKKKRALPSEALIRLQDKLHNSSEREASPKIKPEKRFADLSYLMQSNILNDMEIKFHRSLMKQNTLRNMASWANRRIRTLEETCLEWKSRKIPDEEFIFKVLETPKIFLAWLTRCIQLNESFKIAQQLRASKMFQYIFAIFKYIQSNNLEESILREIDDFMEKEILKKPHKFKPDPVVNFEEGSGKLRKRKKRFRKSSDKLVEKKCFNENPYYVSIKGKPYDNLIQSLFSKKKRALPSEALIRLQDKLDNSSEREASPKIRKSYDNLIQSLFSKKKRALPSEALIRLQDKLDNSSEREASPKIRKSYDNLIQSLFSKKKRALPSEALIRLQDKLDNSSEREASPKIRKSYDNLIQSLFSKKKRALPSEALIRLQDKLDNSSEREASPKIKPEKRFADLSYLMQSNILNDMEIKFHRSLMKQNTLRNMASWANRRIRTLEETCLEWKSRKIPDEEFIFKVLETPKIFLAWLTRCIQLNESFKIAQQLRASKMFQYIFAIFKYIQSNNLEESILREIDDFMEKANRRIRTLEETCLEWKSRKIPDEEFIFKVLETPKIFLAWLTRCIQLNESFKIAQQLRASKMFQYIFAIFKYIQSNNLEESILREIDDFMEKEILKKPHKFKPDPVVNFEEGSGKLRKRKKRFRKSSDKLVEKKCFNENPYYVSIKGKSYDNLIQSLFSKKKRALPSEALIRLQDKLDNSSEREASPKIKPEKRFADLSYLMQSNILNDMEIKFHRSLMKQNTLRNMASWANRRIRTLEETCLEWKSRKILDEEFIFKVLETPKIFLAWLTRCIQLNESFKIAQQLRASKMFQYIFAIFKYIQSNNLEESILREIDDFMEKEILKKPHKFKPDPVVNFEEGSGKLRKRKKRFRKSSDKLVEKKCFNENPYYVSIKGKPYDNLIQSLFSKKKRALPSEALIRLQDKLDNSSEREASPKISPVLRRSTRNITSLFSRNDYFKEKILSGTSEGLKVEIIEGKGRGVMTTRPFSSGEFVTEYCGELINRKEASIREKEYRNFESIGSYMYFFKYRNQNF
ncbi:unnamed protein product [Brassicogethes aeneus]|uniref:Uncharacterized protein n=1 Tax=Brassicogethes aeneus TaxID=1431903 RepID=A0A9P0BGP1_BRAAE|nr:unnamed protein product [Brassicogethes aeneus]